MQNLDKAFADFIAKAQQPLTSGELATQHNKVARELLPHMVERARLMAASHDDSWRHFRVGCAVLAYRPEYEPFDHPNHPDRYKVFEGWNIKKEENGPKICAEQMAISAAMAAGYTTAIVVVVSGPVQADGATGIVGRTLRPCDGCRQFLRTAGIVKNGTHIVTVDPDAREIEILTCEGLLALFPPG